MAGPGVAEKPAVVKEALVSRGRAPAPAGDRVQQRANEIVQTVREQGWRPGAETATTKPVKDYKSKTEMMGTQRDPVTGEKVRVGAERTRNADANKAASMAKAFSEKGYAGIPDGDPMKGALRSAVIAEALTRSDIGDRIRDMTADQQKVWAERILLDPKMQGHARRLYEQVMNGEIKFTETDQAQEELTAAQIDRQEKQKELEDVTNRLTEIDRRLADFARPGGGARWGNRAQALEDLRRDLPALEDQKNDFEQTVSEAKDRLQTLKTERNRAAGGGGRTMAEIDDDINAQNRIIRDNQGDISRIKGQLQQKENLEKEEQELNQKKTELEKEKREKDTAHKKAQAAEQRRRNVLQQAKELRVSEEEDMVSMFQGIIGEATNNSLNEEADALDKAYDQSAKELAGRTDDQNAKALMDALQNAYLGNERVRMRGVIGFRRRESYRPISREAVNRHYDLLMNRDLPNGTIDGGPGEVMTQLLMTRINPDTNRNYTDPEARAIVANKEFRDKYQGEVVKQLLGRRMLSGGIAPEDHHLITNAKWGQGMIDQAIASNQEFRQNVEKTFGAGALSQPGFAEKFGQEARRNPFWFLLLLGIPGLLAGVRGGIGGHSISG